MMGGYFKKDPFVGVVVAIMVLSFALKCFSAPVPPAFLAPAEGRFLYSDKETFIDSLGKTKGLHEGLREVLWEVGQRVSIKVYSGCRSIEKQLQYCWEGKTKLIHGGSHLSCEAFDAVFIKKNGKASWTKSQSLAVCGYVRAVGDLIGVQLRPGCDWNGNLQIGDDGAFFDGPHFEIWKPEIEYWKCP